MEKIVGKILGDDEEKRRHESQQEQLPLTLFGPYRPNRKDDQAAQSRKRKPCHDCGPKMQNSEVDRAQERCPGKYRQCVHPRRADAKVNNDDAGQSKREKSGDHRLAVKLATGSQPNAANQHQRGKGDSYDSIDRHTALDCRLPLTYHHDCTRSAAFLILSVPYQQMMRQIAEAVAKTLLRIGNETELLDMINGLNLQALSHLQWQRP